MIKVKKGYYLKLLTPEKMKLLWSTTSKIRKDKYDENVLYLKITEIVLTHCNVVNNSYQKDSSLVYIFLNKLFSQLLDIPSKTFIFLKAFDSEFFVYWSMVYRTKF